MDEERICALCGEALSEEDEGHILQDGRMVCDDCFEYNCAACDKCGDYVEEDDLTYWGDDYRLCPSCFEEYFPPFDEEKNLEETREAYEGMLKRLVGKKTDQEEGIVEIETDMDEDSFRHSIEVTIDEDGRISDISRLTTLRCRSIGIKSEDWYDYPVDSSDYEEDGLAENIILCEIELIDEDDEGEEE